MVSRILGQRVYLAGPIDRAADDGRGWREWITPELYKRGLIVFDPLDKPTDDAPEDAESRAARHALKRPRTFKDFAAIMKRVRAIDLRMVNTADFMIVWVDLDVHSCGTYEEIACINVQKKPILVVCKQGRAGVPDWMFGQIPDEFFFDTFDDLLKYLDHVAYADQVDHHKRWLFFDLDKVYPECVDRLIRKARRGIH